ncbi:hypothetical protein [Dysosmobacter sp. HCP28S3_G4]|uniref:hypothetical protein n=1 Tax=Dysosmobacter sp. HCP28S3_G4 TaxID=3438938 RepID=UPI003F8B181E
MELIEGIKHIIDGDAVIIMGAGASHGAQNLFGEFPSGSLLAEKLYKKCGIVPDDINDLQDAAQCYEEAFSASALVSEIQSLLKCVSVTNSHEIIYSLPWMRYYTTNYDDVALLAAKKTNINLTPVTLSSNIKQNLNNNRLCIHINGYIGNLNETTLHHEFKLTANSYLSQTNILNSPWGDYLINDLETAKCIVILGLSLKYDLDLSRVIFSEEFRKKAMIISAPNLSPNSENRLNRFGTVYKIGVDGFASEVFKVRQSYEPHTKTPTERLYSAFTYSYKEKRYPERPRPEDIFRLFLNGSYSDSLFFRNNGKYDGFIYRKKFSKIRDAVLNGVKLIFVHSDMGNGKTACINELQHTLSGEDIHIFQLTNADSQKISEEISAIASLSETSSVLVIIDDYTNYMEVLHKFSLLGGKKAQFLLTARSAINYNKMPIILEEFFVEEGATAIFDINKLDEDDLGNCVRVFDQYGLWGTNAGLNTSQKIKYLTSRKSGNCRFQSIMLDVIQSDLMQRKIADTVQIIRGGSLQYHTAVLLILLTKVMNLRLSTSDIERLLEVNFTTDALFKSDPAIKEIITFNDNGDITIKAPVTAQFILQKVSDPEDIIKSLYSLALYAVKYSNLPKYANILTSIISYSHINSFLRGFKNPEQFLSEYYDELSKIEYYRKNNFFWLQYAISCIEVGKFDRAQRYLNNAYGLIPVGFVPFQINNQQARLYLEKIITGQSENILDDFSAAHKLLMIPISSPKDNEYNVVRLFGYYCRGKIKRAMLSDSNEEFYKSACKSAYQRTTVFIERYPIYSEDLTDLRTKLLNSYVSRNDAG